MEQQNSPRPWLQHSAPPPASSSSSLVLPPPPVPLLSFLKFHPTPLLAIPAKLIPGHPRHNRGVGLGSGSRSGSQCLRHPWTAGRLGEEPPKWKCLQTGSGRWNTVWPLCLREPLSEPIRLDYRASFLYKEGDKFLSVLVSLSNGRRFSV